MATSQRRRDRAADLTRRAIVEVGSQVRIARRTVGLSLRAAATAVGMDHALLSRIERGQVPNVTVAQLARASAAVGLDLRLRTYLAGDAPRDIGQQRLLARFRARLPPDAPWATEVPMPIQGDLRGVDGWTRLEGGTVGVEAEARLGDVQAIERKALLKQRDANLDVMVLLVADTRGNRGVLERHRDALVGAFPLDTRAILWALSRGRAPAANGIVVL